MFDEPMQSCIEVANKFIKSGEPVTYKIINKLLAIYNIHVTEEGLKLLINTPGFVFENLNKNLTKDPYFIEKVGKKDKDCVKGIYMFTHKLTGSKYVGSSKYLATRLHHYVVGSNKSHGKISPAPLDPRPPT